MLKPETIIAALAFCVSVLSLYYATEQSKSAERHNRLSVQPHLTFRWDEDHRSNIYRLRVRNTGIGPARLTDFRLAVDEKAVAPDSRGGWDNVFSALPEITQISQVNVDWLERDDGMRPGDEFVLFKYEITDEVVEQPFNDLLTILGNPEEADRVAKAKLVSAARRQHFQQLGRTLTRITVEIEYESFYGDARPVARYRYAIPNSPKN